VPTTDHTQGSDSTVPIIAGAVCASLVAALLLLYYKRKSEEGEQTANPALREALLDNDGLEMSAAPTLDQHMATAEQIRGAEAAPQVMSLYPITAMSPGAAPAVCCKVLITGEASADVRGIEASIFALGAEFTAQTGAKIEVTSQAIPLREQTQLDSFMTATLSDFNAIIIAIDASQIWLNVIGAGGSATGVMDKCGFHGIPSEAIYFVATGDTSEMDPTEVMSGELKHKLGPMQLNVLADYIQYGRFLSWDRQPAQQQKELLMNHLQYLAHNKPESQIDPARFKCALCRDKLPMKYLRERVEEGHDFKVQATLCTNCSIGHCSNCGEQLVPEEKQAGEYSWDSVTGCLHCGCESSSSGGQAGLLSEILSKTAAELKHEKIQKTATFPRTGNHLGAISFDVPDNLGGNTGNVAPATGMQHLNNVERL
jgi:hypothetical protein